MEGKNEKNSSPSKTPKQQQRPQMVGVSTQSPPSLGVQEPHSSSSQGSSSSGGPLRGVGGMPPASVHAIPVDGCAGDATGSVGGLVMEATSRKRAREVSERLGTVGSGDQLPFECRVCRKRFPTDKSLFGHLRTHGGRGWKGTFPPPVFSREEFAETGLLNPEGGEEGQGEQENQQVAHEATPAVEGATVGVQEAIDGLNVLQPQALEGQVLYHVPDLNRSPPEDQGNGNGKDNDKH